MSKITGSTDLPLPARSDSLTLPSAEALAPPRALLLESSDLVVQKYGGATLATPELVKAAAKRLLEQSRKGPLIAVVSAMGTTTNSLLELAAQITKRPNRRELDMLLSVGERTSMALVSMALYDLGAAAISFTGSQAGILTDEDHFNAKVIDVKPFRVEESLAAGKIVILAGFQGVSPKTKEITTLGRGGSDVTAVAMAAALGARRCEILKEVPAVFTGDPRVVPTARPIRQLEYDQLLDMTFWGAKVLHHRSVDLARHRGVSLYIGPASDDHAAGTLVGKGITMYETHRPLSLNSHDSVLEVELGNSPAALAEWQAFLTANQVPTPQILGWSKGNRVLVTAPREILKSMRESLAGSPYRVADASLCSVTLTCSGSVSPEVVTQVLAILSSAGLVARDLRVSPLSVSVFLAESDRARALEILHPLIPA